MLKMDVLTACWPFHFSYKPDFFLATASLRTFDLPVPYSSASLSTKPPDDAFQRRKKCYFGSRQGSGGSAPCRVKQKWNTQVWPYIIILYFQLRTKKCCLLYEQDDNDGECAQSMNCKWPQLFTARCPGVQGEFELWMCDLVLLWRPERRESNWMR